MDRKVLAVIVAALVLCTAAAALMYPSLAKPPPQKNNLADVYILSWDLNTTDQYRGIGVQFVISIDTDGDGTYDVVRTSLVMNDTIGEIAPFHLGAVIPQEQRAFSFQVKVLRVDGGADVVMRYTADGTNPALRGDNVIGSTSSWTYDATGGDNSDGKACRVSIAYLVGEAA